jgi:CxxC-x17-CxxC domain-containing protein
MSDDDKSKTDEVVEEVAAEAVEEKEVEEKPAEAADAPEPEAEKPADDTKASSEPTPAGTDQQGRQLFNVKCSNCGKDTQVPFKPSGDRPVYCRDCYMQKKNS